MKLSTSDELRKYGKNHNFVSGARYVAYSDQVHRGCLDCLSTNLFTYAI